MRYFLIVSLSILLFSCSKNSTTSTPPVVKDSVCQLVTVRWNYNNILYTTNLTYNSDGKLSEKDDGLGNSTTYTYSGNKIFISSDNGNTVRDTTILNDIGYTEQFIVNAPPVTSVSSFYYSVDTVLDHSIFTSPQITAPDTTTYVFTNGDLTTTVSGGTTYNFTYYPDQAEQVADFAIYNQLTSQGSLAYKNKHLTKSYSTNSTSSQYVYNFDAAGKIASIEDHYTNAQGSGVVTYYYSYACHL